MSIVNMLVERQGISFSKGFCTRSTGMTDRESTKDIFNEWARGSTGSSMDWGQRS